MELKIEKGVPLPPDGRKQLGGVTAAFRAMEVGDSVLLLGKKHSSVGAIVARLKPKKFATRSVDGGLRVWRVA